MYLCFQFYRSSRCGSGKRPLGQPGSPPSASSNWSGVGWPNASWNCPEPGDAIWIVAGKGHNGDDARAALPGLSDRSVTLLDVSDPRQGREEFLKRIQRDAGCPPRWIIDALFGIGLNRPLDDQWRELIDALNNSGVPILAVDVPSGLNADTGQPEGAAIKAELTLTVGAPKAGLLRGACLHGTGGGAFRRGPGGVFI